MPRFFAEVDGQRALIRGADAQHISGPLRIRLGEDLLIRDGDKGYLARVTGVSRQQVELEILDEQVLADRGPRTVRLGMALIAPKDMDEVIRLATELGVSEIQPVIMSRSNVRDLKAQRLERWQEIVREAVKQNQRRSLPTILPVLDFRAFLAQSNWARPLVALPGADQPLTAVNDSDVGILIGPEGGIAPDEIESLLAGGFQPVGLGATVLRAVTAAAAAVAVLGM